MKRWEESGWKEDDLNNLELSFLHDIFSCKEAIQVSSAMSYASYLKKVGVNPDNYPIFLKFLEFNNHWVIDALIGDTPTSKVFDLVQPNYYIVKECFKILALHRRGGVYPKALLVIFGLLEKVYKNPLEGYRVYDLNATDVNNLGKHLDEKKDQTYDVNKTILAILDKIAALTQPGRPEDNPNIILVSTQANNIRGKFLDITKSLDEAIPENLLKIEDYTKEEVAPLK
ncbi:MAG: hypothetical protein JXR63_12960 [Spirochaetales bacterium]|nr:hypothetical protein [Spirochaetales bacterium]